MASKLKIILFYATIFLCILAYGATAQNYDFDLWARLIAGMGFVQTGHVLTQDFLSYTPTHIWYDHEWGSGVIFYLTQHFFSVPGLLILQTILYFFTFFFIVQTIKLRGVKNTSAFNILFYFFTFVAICYNLLNVIRCQLFSFLFFAIFLYILELSRKGKDKALYLIPFLMIIWNNLHGGCVAGLGLIGLYALGEFLNKQSYKKYLIIFIISFLVLIINPWGIPYLKFLFGAAFMKRPYIVEWWGLFSKRFVTGYLQVKFYVLVLFIAEAIYLILKNKAKDFKFDFTKFLVLAFTIEMAIMHVKLVPFMVMSIAVFMYNDFYIVFNLITKNLFNNKIVGIIKDIFVYTILIYSSIYIIKVCQFRPLITFKTYPVVEVEFIKINHLKGNILSNFGHGSYISYKLYPHNKIYMDGRYEEVYYNDLVPLLRDFELGNAYWKNLLIKYPADLIIVEKFYPVYLILNKDKEWKNVLEDDNFALFMKRKDAKTNYKMPPKELSYYQKRLFDTDIKF